MNAATIVRTMKRSGQPMILTRAVQGIYNPIAGGMSGGTTETYTIYGITGNYGQSEISAPNSLIQSGDKKAIIEATVKPVTGDILQIIGESWNIISFNELSPQGVALLYTCQIRR